ncbi:MAG: hypothetical protein K8S97_06045 [Anaerolineae bacterium]|nr:hypothetical protein [Anaerolineae bacterium]
MQDHVDLPGPGEQKDHAASVGETPITPAPDGAAPRVDGPQYVTQEMAPITPRDVDEARDSVQHDRLRRTGTERDGYEAVTASDTVTERRLDDSADDYLREEASDPVQDNAGPTE